MKKLLVLLILSIAMSPVFTYALTLPSGREQKVETAFNSWLSTKISSPDSKSKTQSLGILFEKIQIARSQTSDSGVIQLLDFIQSLLIKSLDEGSDIDTKPVIAVGPKAHQDQLSTRLEFDPESKFTDTEQVILAGSTKQVVAEFELTANREAIRLEEFEIIGSSTLVNHVDMIHIYDQDGDLVASDLPTSNKASFRGVHYLLEQGTTRFYVLLDTKNVGRSSQAPEGTSFTLRLNVEEARGYSSGDDISVRSRDYSNTIYITPVKIDGIETFQTYDGFQVDTRLSDGIENTLGIFVISSQKSDNEIASSPEEAKIQIHTLTFKVTDTSKSAALTLQLQRADNQTQKISGLRRDDEVTFTLPSDFFSNIENGQQAVYVVTTTPDLDDDDNEAIQVSLIDLNSGGVVYSSNEPGAQQYSQLNLGFKDIRAEKIFD